MMGVAGLLEACGGSSDATDGGAGGAVVLPSTEDAGGGGSGSSTSGAVPNVDSDGEAGRTLGDASNDVGATEDSGKSSVDAGNLIGDGDFSTPPEDPNAAFGGSTDGGIALGAWTAEGNIPQSVQLWAGDVTTLPPGSTGQTCWLVFTGVVSSVSQVVPTIAGHQYQLTFALGNDPFYSSAGTSLAVIWGGVPVETFTSPSGGASALGAIPISPAWANETVTVTATSASSTLEFAVGIDTDASYDIVALTNVGLVDLGN